MAKSSFFKNKSILRFFTVAVLLIVIIIGGWLSQIGLGLHQTIYDKDFYRCALQEVELEDDLRVILIEYVIIESDYSVSLALSEVPLVKNALASAIDEEWLKGKIDKHLDDAVDFIFGDRDKFVVKVPLAEKQQVFEEELNKEWKDYHGYARLEELEIEAPDPGVFIEKIDLPGEITIVELTDLSEIGEEEQKAILYVRGVKPALQAAPFFLNGLLLTFSLVAFGIINGLRLFGSGLFLSGLSLYLYWQFLKDITIRHVSGVMETHGLSLLSRPEITLNLYNCLQSNFINIHIIFMWLGLLFIITAILVQFTIVIVKRVNSE